MELEAAEVAFVEEEMSSNEGNRSQAFESVASKLFRYFPRLDTHLLYSFTSLIYL